MGPTDIVDRLAAVDHELSRVETQRALPQTEGDDTEVQRLDRDISQLSKVRDDLRKQLRGLGAE
jgi:hypothetical protein